MRVLVAGFQHETNTFAPAKADLGCFEHGGMFPHMHRGAEVLGLAAVNIPIGGFIQSSSAAGWENLPAIWAGATPSAHVTRDAYEQIADIICSSAVEQLPDAIYLDLHGAMVCEHIDDGEGILLKRLRAIVGRSVPIVASLDLHANVSQLMMDQADGLIAFRTYPHEDMADTGTRAFKLLAQLVAGRKLTAKLVRLPFLIPINSMATDLQPAKGTYSLLSHLEDECGAIASISFAPGFPAADIPDCRGSLWAYGDTSEAVEAVLDALYERVVHAEPEWRTQFYSPDEAVMLAQELSAGAARPVIIADTQDNPGAGGTSDSTAMLRALIERGATDACIGLIVDPEAAAIAHRAGQGAHIEISLGGRSGAPGDKPLRATFCVEQLSDGRCRFGGPMMKGKLADVGPTARLSIAGIQIVVCSLIDQMIDRNLYRMAGIDPEAMKIIVNKSSVHFRADFEPIAEAILIAKAPGPVCADPTDLHWTRLADGVRTGPLGPTFNHRGS